MSDLYDKDPQSLIHRPDKDDIAMAVATGKVCGECKHFEVAEGRNLMRAQQFVETLVREHKWKVHHLCSPLNDLGLCGQSVSGVSGDAAAVTGRLHKSCDMFRPNNGLVSLTRKTTDPR